MKLSRYNTTDTYKIDGGYLGVDTISQDTWLYGVGNVASGAIAFSNDSATLNFYQKNNTIENSSTGYILCLGDVLNFTQPISLNLTGDTNETAPFLFIGGNDTQYNNITAEIANTTALTLTANAYNLFDCNSTDCLQIGVYDDSVTAGNFESIEFASPNGTVYDSLSYFTINPAYQGVGLPFRFWEKLMQYIRLQSVALA